MEPVPSSSRTYELPVGLVEEAGPRDLLGGSGSLAEPRVHQIHVSLFSRQLALEDASGWRCVRHAVGTRLALRVCQG